MNGGDRDPGAEQDGVGNAQEEERDGRERALDEGHEAQTRQVTREREGEVIPELPGVPPVADDDHTQVGRFYISYVHEQVYRDEKHPEQGQYEVEGAGDETQEPAEDLLGDALGEVQEILTDVRHKLLGRARQEATLGERLQQVAQKLLGIRSVTGYVAGKREQLGYQDRHEDGERQYGQPHEEQETHQDRPAAWHEARECPYRKRDHQGQRGSSQQHDRHAR